MSDDSDIEDINVCRKGKRKICVVNDSNSDSDDSQIINNNRRQRLQVSLAFFFKFDPIN